LKSSKIFISTSSHSIIIFTFVPSGNGFSAFAMEEPARLERDYLRFFIMTVQPLRDIGAVATKPHYFLPSEDLLNHIQITNGVTKAN